MSAVALLDHDRICWDHKLLDHARERELLSNAEEPELGHTVDSFHSSLGLCHGRLGFRVLKSLAVYSP